MYNMMASNTETETGNVDAPHPIKEYNIFY
jgi:hypothetical protein